MKEGKITRQYDQDEADALCELCNVGIGKATNALGKMINERITIQTPKLFEVSKNASDIMKDYNDKVAMGIIMKLKSTLGGAVLIIIAEKFISQLIETLTGVMEKDAPKEDYMSVVQEVANVMSASYMTAIGSYTGLRIYLTPVKAGLEKVSDLVMYPVEKMSLDIDASICIGTSFVVQGADSKPENCDGYIIIFPDDKSIDILMKAMLG